MTQSLPPRNVGKLSESVLHQLNLYAAGATAAGVGVLALAQPSEAKIIYKQVHHIIGRNDRYKLDLNHDKMIDLTFVNTHGCNQDYCTDALSASAPAGNAVEGKYTLAYALPHGAVIGPKQPFSGKIMALSSSSEGSFGQWANVSNRYLGVRFNIKGKAHYGWVRLSVRLSGHARITGTVTGYAYETVPNKAIVAGKTNGQDVVTAEPTLGDLARGTSTY